MFSPTMHSPTPGWVAHRLGGYGHELLLSTLAAAALDLTRRTNNRVGSPDDYTDGDAILAALDTHALHDGEVHPTFAMLADADDPGWELGQIWAQAIADFPYLAAAAEPLTAWMVDAPPSRLENVRHVAAEMANVDTFGLIANCPGGMLTEIHNQLVNVLQRRGEAVEFEPLRVVIAREVFNSLLAAPSFRKGMRILDVACAGGERLRGAAYAGAMHGLGVEDITFLASDFDPLALAITAVGLACIGAPHVSTWLAAFGDEWPADFHDIDLMLWNVGETMDRWAGPAAVRAHLEQLEASIDVEEAQAAADVLRAAAAITADEPVIDWRKVRGVTAAVTGKRVPCEGGAC